MSNEKSSLSERTIDLMDWSGMKSELTWIYEGPVRSQDLESTTFVAGQTAFLIRKGDVLIQTDKGSMTAHTGQWIFPREGLRRQKFSPGTVILSVHFDLTWPGNQRLYEWDVAEVFESIEVPRLEREAQRLAQWIEKVFPNAFVGLLQFQSDLETRLHLQQRFLKWLVVYTQTLKDRGWLPIRLGRMDSRVLYAVQLLDRLPLNQLFRENQLASQVGLSISQLDRLFVKQFAMTPRQHLENRRLQEAAIRMQSSSDSFKQIAFDFGFGSLSHFSTWFRRKARLSPREFRMQRKLFPRKDGD